MTSKYDAIRTDNERRYGTDIGRIGPMLLADRYDDRTHFIFELLQNAEDALAKRIGWNGHRSISFQLLDHQLRINHFGKPFDEADVRGVCGIAESTKDLTAIGRFGIGFKSVYAFTDRPEVHSGNEHFSIGSFVWPIAAAPIEHPEDETLIVLPLRVAVDRDEIVAGLKRLGAGSLLFLRQIEEIEWKVKAGPSGLYMRSQPEILAEGVRRVIVIGQSEGHPDIEESWLVFSKAVNTPEGKHAGYVELAFSLTKERRTDTQKVRPVTRSPLVVFFPTVVETHLGFLAQGPYRTTPSRDNVPSHDAWNQHCVSETAKVLLKALRWLRDQDFIDVGALRCLPLDRSKFGQDAMLAPIFEAAKSSLTTEDLLPCYGGGYASARGVRLARTQDLRELLNPPQLATLLGVDGELAWLSGDVSQDRFPEIREYLMEELGIEEVRAETILPKLGAGFLEVQSDDWVRRLYEFLGTQKALLSKARELPLIRLTTGKHIQPYAKGQPQAFLPSPLITGFPTVRSAVCTSEESSAFLQALGLTAPDPVDDVIRNVLPKYHEKQVDVTDETYAPDIRRVLTAFATDSKAQREKLLAALRATAFVMAAGSGDGLECVSTADKLYLATERLKDIFADVPDVLLVDDRYSCLRGEDVRELLETCGAVRYPRPVEDASLGWEQRRSLREQVGHAETSGYNDRVTDWMLAGLQTLLATLPALGSEERRRKSSLLWEELAHLEERRGKGVFTGEYTWTHYGSYRTTFDAAFVRLLNDSEWIPDADRSLQRPGLVLFESLGWKPNPFLLTKIRFKPAIIDQLAKEAGIEPGVLDLLKKLGVTSEAELRARLKVDDDHVPVSHQTEANGDPLPPPTYPKSSDENPVSPGSGAAGGGVNTGVQDEVGNEEPAPKDGKGDPDSSEAENGGGSRTPGNPGGRPFVSYVGSHPDEEGPDPDGLDHATRMSLEAQAIDLIIASEPDWHRTPAFNPGYDLFKAGPDKQPTRWCEVKAMTGSLHDRPVGMSHTQFEYAREHGERYWLYVVEHAAGQHARIVRIHDPASKARTFTFDHGWISVADLNPPAES